MTLYRKFGNALAVLVCIAMAVMCVVFVITNGVSTVDADKGEVIYFYEKATFQGYLFVALSFWVSVIANICAVELSQISTGISLLPLVMTFYEMAVGNMNFVVAAIVLLLALIHVASNAIAWHDQRAAKAKDEVAMNADAGGVESDAESAADAK